MGTITQFGYIIAISICLVLSESEALDENSAKERQCFPINATQDLDNKWAS